MTYNDDWLEAAVESLRSTKRGDYAKWVREAEAKMRPLRDEGLTTRASNVVVNETGTYDPETAAWIIADYFSQADLMRVTNCGKKSVKEVRLWLERHGYELQGTPKRCPHCGGVIR